MSHSHIPIKHLLKQVETYATKRNNRDVRPDWLTALIDTIAELFEPITGIGRVGFDCQFAEDCWIVGMYLGSTEIVGGPDDGRSRLENFEIDLESLRSQFSNIEEFYWSAFPEPFENESSPARSYLTISGRVEENALRLQIFTTPPDGAGTGLRQLPDGSREPM